MASPKMSTTLTGVLLVAALSAAAASIAGAVGVSDLPTAYDLLEQYDLPRGILPEGVHSYLLRSDGSFDVYMAGGDCEFRVAGYTLRYGRKLSGTVRRGEVAELKGVAVRVLVLWIGIDRVVLTDDGQLKFFVGPLSAAFPASNFEESPRCRCGFECATAAAAVLASAV